MKSLLLFPLLSAFLTLAGSVSPAVAQAIGTPVSAKEDTGAKKGIRFVFEAPNPGVNELYIPLSDKATKSIVPLMGLPSLRIPFPLGGKLALFTQDPSKGKKSPPETWAPVPGNAEKILCLVTGTKGHFKMMFFNEDELPSNSVLILNRTSRPYLLVLPSPPSGEKQQILIPGGGQYIFGKGLAGSPPREYPVNLMVEYTLKDGSKRWLKDRSFSISPYGKGSQILLFAPNDEGTAMLFQKILLPRN